VGNGGIRRVSVNRRFVSGGYFFDAMAVIADSIRNPSWSLLRGVS
jgi:hypothetical protein